MTAAEKQEHARLSRRWATQRATLRQIERCMELDRKARAAAKADLAYIARNYETALECWKRRALTAEAALAKVKS